MQGRQSTSEYQATRMELLKPPQFLTGKKKKKMFIDRKGESMETSVSNNPDDHLSFSNVSNLPATSVTYDFFRTELLLQEASVKHLQFFSECPCQGFIY